MTTLLFVLVMLAAFAAQACALRAVQRSQGLLPLWPFCGDVPLTRPPGTHASQKEPTP